MTTLKQKVIELHKKGLDIGVITNQLLAEGYKVTYTTVKVYVWTYEMSYNREKELINLLKSLYDLMLTMTREMQLRELESKLIDEIAKVIKT